MATWVANGTPGTTSATLPAGTATGDWVVCCAYRDLNAAPPTLPAGWTTLVTRAVAPSILIAYREKDASWSAMPTFTNAGRTDSIAIRPASGKQLAAGVSASQGATSTSITWAVQTLQVADGTSVIIRGAVGTRPDVTIPTPTNHTLVSATGNRPGYITVRKTTSTDMAAASSAVSRSDIWSTAQVEIKDVIAVAVTQAAYGFYADGTETASTALASQDAPPSVDVTTGDLNLQLRMRLQSTSAAVVPATDDWQLQWERNADGNWFNIGSTVAVYDSANLTDAAATTNRLGAGTGSFVAGKVSEDGLADNVGWTANNYTELLYSIKLQQANLNDGDVLRFRVLRNAATTTMTYSSVPTINVAKTIPLVTQAGYRIYDQGTESGSVALAAQNTAHTGDIGVGDGIGQLRVLLQSTNAAPPLSTDDWQLQFEKNASGTWLNVDLVESSTNFAAHSATPGASIPLNSGVVAVGQTFLGIYGRLNLADFTLSKTGSPTSNLTASVYAHTGVFGTSGVPTGTALATSNVVTAASLSTTPTETSFTFASPFTMTPDTLYVVVIQASATGDASNYVGVRQGAASADGNFVSNSGSWTANSAIDLLYTFWALIPAQATHAYDDPSLTNGAATTNRLTGGTGSFSAGKVSEDGLVDDLGFTANGFTELLYSVRLSKTAYVAGDTVRFRVLRNGATTGVTYSQTPTINLIKTLPAVTQAGYQFYDNSPGPPTLSASYDESNASFETSIGASGDTTARGQSFLGDGRPLRRAGFFLRRAGTTAGSMTAKLYAHSGTYGQATSLPTGTPLATSTTVVAAGSVGTTAAWVEFDFDGTYTLGNGTPYFISMDAGVLSGFDNMFVSIDSTVSTHGGSAAAFSSSWVGSSQDTIFRVYTSGSNEASSNPLAAQNTPITGNLTTGDGIGSLRVLLQSTTAAPLPITDDWQLQYEKNVSGTWVNVGIVHALVDNYPEINQNTVSALGSITGGSTTNAQAFLGTGRPLTKARFKLGKTGTPTGNLTATLWAHTGTFGSGTPSGGVGGYLTQSTTAFSIASLTTTSTWVEFLFDGSFTLANGTAYYIGVTTTQTPSDANYVQLGTDNTPAHAGNLAVLQTGGWGISAFDLIFEVYGNTAFVAPYNDPALTDGQATTNRLTGTGTFSPGKVSEDGLVDNLGFPGNNFTELLYPVQISKSAFVQGDTIRFRVLRNGSPITITQTPQVNVVKVNSGTATFSHTWDVTASGVMPTVGGGVGSATFNWNADFTATGDHGREGTAELSWSSDLTAVGKMDPVGTAAVEHFWTTTATGSNASTAPRQGSATFQHSWSFTAESVAAVAQFWLYNAGPHPGVNRGDNSANLRGTAFNWTTWLLGASPHGSATNPNVTSIAGPTVGIEVDSTSTNAYEWISLPIDRNVTVAGTIQCRVGQFATTAALGTTSINMVINRLDSQGAIISEVGRSANTTPTTGSQATNNFNITPTSTNFLKGDRIRVRVYFDDAGATTMVAGGTATSAIGGAAGATSEAFVKFTESFTFLTAEPTGTILYLKDTAGPAVGANLEKEMWTGRGAIAASAVANTVLGRTAPVQWTSTAGGTAIEWYSKALEAFTLDGLVELNIRAAQSAAGAAAMRAELAICNDDGSGAVVWGANTLVNTPTPGGSFVLSANGRLQFTENTTKAWLAGAPTAVAAGKRLRFRMFLDDEDGNAMTAGRTATITYDGPTAAAAGDTWIQLPQIVTEYVQEVTVSKFQFFDEGTESGSTPLSAENSSLSIDTLDTHNLQLRFQLQSTSDLAIPSTTDWQLEWGVNGSDWTPISNTDAVVYIDSASLTDGAATTRRLSVGSGTFVAGKVSEDGLADDVGFSGNNYTELVFSIQARFLSFADGESTVFRVVPTGASPPVMTHAVQPQLFAVVQVGDDSTGTLTPNDGRDIMVAAATAAPVHTGTLSLADGRDTLAATVAATVPTSTSTLVLADGIDEMVATATSIDLCTGVLAVSDRIDAFGATATSEPPISESTLEFTDNPDTIVATGTLEPPIHAGTLTLADGEDTLSAQATAGIYLNRSVTQAPRNGTTSHTVNFTPATAGNLLLAFAEGSVTSTTPAGWELRSSAVNNTGLYCWTKIATAGESSFTTTHNGSNYPCAFAVYEYPAGSAFAVENSAINQSSTADNPIVTLNPVAVYTVFTAYGWGYASPSVDPAPNATWIGGVEDVDVFEPFVASDGYLFGIAIQDGVTGVTADTATPTVNNTAGGNSERITVALNLAGSTTHTGNFSGTDGADALTASVSTTAPTITATLALTDGRDTLVASGDRTVPLFTGAMAQTDGLDTLVAAGSTTAPTHTGTIAQTDGADALAATVSTTAPTFTSTLALTDGLDALVASGSTTLPTFTGTLALTDGQDTLVASATAGEVTTATLALTDSRDTIVATADTTPPTLTSTLSVSDRVDTLAASLSLTVPLFVSTASQTDGADSIVTTVNITPPPNPSTLSISDGLDTLAALVSAGAVGAAVLALADGPDTITAAGTTTAPTFTASLALTDGLDALVSVPTTIVPSQEATASVADGLDTIIATASTIAPTFTSSAAATDGADTLVAPATAIVPVFMSNLVAADSPDTLAASASATTPVFTSTLELTDGEDTIVATVAHAAPGNSAGGVTVTDGEDTLIASASATIPTLTGTLAISDGVDTLAIAVQFLAINEPTLASTDGADTLVASASATVPLLLATLVAFDSLDTIVSTGSTVPPTVTSSMDVTETPDILSAVGTHAAPGNSAAALTVADGLDTMVATATRTIPTVTATVAVSDGVDTLEATVQSIPINTVALAQADGNDTIVTSTSLTVPLLVGFVIVTEGTDTMSAAATSVVPTFTSTLAFIDGSDTLDAFATAAVPLATSTVTFTDNRDTIVTSVQTIVPIHTATLDLTDSPDTVAASVVAGAVGAAVLAMSDGLDTMVATATTVVPTFSSTAPVTDGRDSLEVSIATIPPTHSGTLALTDKADTLAAPAVSTPPVFESTLTFTDGQDTLVTTVAHVVPTFTATAATVEGRDTFVAVGLHAPPGNSAGGFGATDGRDTMVAAALCLFGHTILSGYALEMKRIDKLRACTRIDDDREMERMDKPTVIRPATSEKGILVP